VTPEAFAARLVETPFVPFGRDYDGVDCWGAVWLAYRDVLGIELPSGAGCYSSAEARQEIEVLFEQRHGAWERHDAPKVMDVALMRVHGALCHTGLIVGRRQMLHSLKGIGTCIEDHGSLRWRNRIEGFYRHVPC
jgi:cell wall-associated NlpC family hydrolase